MPMAPMPTRAAATDDSPDASSIAGGASDNGQPSPDQDRNGAVQTVRQITSQIQAIAQQFPEFAEAARAANQALVKGAVAITGNSRDQGKSGAPPAQ